MEKEGVGYVLSIFDKIEVRPSRFQRGQKVAVHIPCISPSVCNHYGQEKEEHPGVVEIGELIMRKGRKWVFITATHSYYLDLRHYKVVFADALPLFDKDDFCKYSPVALDSAGHNPNYRSVSGVVQELLKYYRRIYPVRPNPDTRDVFSYCDCGRIRRGRAPYKQLLHMYVRSKDAEALSRLIKRSALPCCRQG
jgi:hypothetical protein